MNSTITDPDPVRAEYAALLAEEYALERRQVVVLDALRSIRARLEDEEGPE